MNPYRLRAYFYLLIVAAVWGIAGPIIKFTLQGISPLPFLTYRFGVSALASLVIMFFLKTKLPSSKTLLAKMIFYGFITSTVALGLLFLGLEKTTVLDMTLITAVNPLLVALAGVVFLNEHVTTKEKVGMGIALLGTTITTLDPLFSDGINLEHLTGNLLIVLYLLVNTVAAVTAKGLLRKGISPLTLTNISFIIGFLTILPITLAAGGWENFYYNLKILSFPFQLGVLYMALISGNLAYTLWTKGQKSIEIGEAALFSYLSPLFSTPLAVIWLKEKITPFFVFGAIAITIGVFIAEHKKRKTSNKSLA